MVPSNATLQNFNQDSLEIHLFQWRQLITFLKAFKIFLTGQPKECRILGLNEFLFQLSIDNINLFNWFLCQNIKNLLQIGFLLGGGWWRINWCWCKCIFSFSSFLSILCLPESVGRIFINHFDDKDVELKFISLHANYQMEALLQANVHRILLLWHNATNWIYL